MEHLMSYIMLLGEIVIVSTTMYMFMHRKTHISLNYMYKDNLLNIIIVTIATYFCLRSIAIEICAIIIPIFILASAGILFVIRFYRKPFWRRRVLKTLPNQIISSADGRVIYIKQVQSGEIPVSVKNGVKATLTEIAQTEIIVYPCWLIGIEMTPFDVHRNAAPIDGKIVLNKHILGGFRSLKDPEALAHNERNTMVFKMRNGTNVGIVQTASRLVRRIVTYRKEGDWVQKGEWIGMIKFGSQVDMIIPADSRVCVKIGDQVYVNETIIAEL